MSSQAISQVHPAPKKVRKYNTLKYVVKDFDSSSFKPCLSYAEVKVERHIINNQRPSLLNSIDCFQAMRPYFGTAIETVEQVVVAFVDSRNKVNLITTMFVGGIDSSVVDIRLIVSTALLTLSAGVVLMHNHPSGGTQPSKADMDVNIALKGALAYFGIKLLDNIIITKGDYFSFTDEKMI